MTGLEIVGLASSLSLLAGWRLYAAILAAGLAVRFGPAGTVDQFAGLAMFANPWVMAVAAAGTLAEFFADKVAWFDSLWDAVHTFVRPVGGALLALAVVQPGDGVFELVTVLLGGSAALAAHSAKAASRAIVNTSPEPLSNIAVSTLEDGLTTGGLYLSLAHPALAGIVAALVLALTVGLIAWGWRTLQRLWRRFNPLPSKR